MTHNALGFDSPTYDERTQETAVKRTPKGRIRQLALESRYLLASFPLAIAAFVLAITLTVLGVATLIIWIGVPILAASLITSRGFSAVERAMLPSVLGRELPYVEHRYVDEDASIIRRLFNSITDGQNWLNILWMVIHFPISIISFVLTVCFWAVMPATLLWPLYGWIIMLAVGRENMGPSYAAEWLGWGDSYLAMSLVSIIAGLIASTILYALVRSFAFMQANMSAGMLTGLSKLHQRIDDLEESRESASVAETDALRRLERDIHDGPQQRLVALGMDLTRAKRQMENNPEAATATLAEAISQTQEAIGELRAVSRGIAPPILSDRGLRPAIEAVAARSAIPVDVDVDLFKRYGSKAENSVYFFVAEALTNVAKHSGATKASVTVYEDDRMIVAMVADNGKGGAHVSKGHGLAGLVERVRSVEGNWTLDSPEGGPTVIGAEIPCA